MKIVRTPIWLVLTILFLLGCASAYEKKPCIFSETKPGAAWDERKLDEAFQLACESGTSTLMIITNGKVVKSMGELDEPLRVHSVRKALLSAIVGQHIGKKPGQINLDSTLADLNINDNPNPLTSQQQQVKVLNLIKSISGINHAAAAEAGLMEAEWFLKKLGIRVIWKAKEGSAVKKDGKILGLKGRADRILGAERTLLNLVQRMSGVATAASGLVTPSRSPSAHSTEMSRLSWRIGFDLATVSPSAFNSSTRISPKRDAAFRCSLFP